MAKPALSEANVTKILVVDDDRKLVNLVRIYLEREGYGVYVAYDGQSALTLAHQLQPDLIVLDLLLPEVDGLDVCRILHAESHVPIIMLTAKTTEEDKLVGLDLGADDYVTKPFSPRELVARVRAVLRRTGKETQDTAEVCVGDLVIVRTRHEVRLCGRAVSLTPTEFDLLQVLAGEPGRVFSRLELLNRVFGYDFDGYERTIDVHIKNLRKKLALSRSPERNEGAAEGAANGIEADPRCPAYVKTVFGVGYKLEED